MCVSYRRLNAVTKPFQFLIPRCDDAISLLSYGAVLIWIISLDAQQGYHQVAIRQSDMDKTAFFAPDDLKYCFTVMPFGPTNYPGFYTCMMRDFKGEWEALFIIRVASLKVWNNLESKILTTKDIIIGSRKVV